MVTAPTQLNDSRLLTKVAWRLTPFIMVLYIVSYLDRINVSFAGLQMNKDLGFSSAVFGFGAGIFFIGYSIFAVPSNLLIERFGARRLISVIMVAWGIITVCMCLVRTDISFYTLRFMLGIAEAGFFPGMILYLTYWFPKKEHALAVARFMTAIPIAGVLGSLMASMLLNIDGVFAMAGWQLLFLASGAPAIIFGIIVFFYLTDGPDKASWLAPSEKSRLKSLLMNEDRSNSEQGKPNILDTIKLPTVWFFALLYFTLTLGMYGFQLWLPQIIHAFGSLSDSKTALLSAIPAIFQAIGLNIVGRSSDKTGERRWHLAVSASLAAISLIVAGITHNPWLGLAALSLTASGLWGTAGPFWAMPTSKLTREQAAVGIGVINSVGNLGGFVGPYLIGYIRTAAADESSGFMFGLFAMAVSLFCSAALALSIKRTSP